MSKMVQSLPQAINTKQITAVGLPDSVQEPAEMNPDTLDFVPCCGEPTELPLVVNMVDEPISNNSEDVDETPATFEELFEREMGKCSINCRRRRERKYKNTSQNWMRSRLV